MIECMDGVTGEDRHDDFRPADYTVYSTERFVESYYCRACLLEFVRDPMVVTVIEAVLLRPRLTEQDNAEDKEIMSAIRENGARSQAA